MKQVVAAASAFIAMISAAQAGQVWLTMDYVRPYKLEQAAHNIIVGNPSIADVTAQDSNNLLLFGKTPGMTNIYIMDKEGNTIDNLIVRVRTAASDMLTLHHGSARKTYNCTTHCEQTIMVGDDLTSSSELIEQAAGHFKRAQTAAAASENAGE